MSDRFVPPDDERLARLIGSVRAEADPIVWDRVRAQIAGRERAGGLPSWMVRPRTLAASLALCATSFVLAFVLASAGGGSASDDPAKLADALRTAVEGSDLIVATDTTTPVSDSGSVR